MNSCITPDHAKGLSILWGALDETLITGHESGEIIKWDVASNKKVRLKFRYNISFYH